ncbi:hypothetical protein GGR55DRAFT_137398 [Xylaria sp. FL0064]|nr:hypothetical protein GGR55DRAFT_137398 [Xylaria sp. FL0064]
MHEDGRQATIVENEERGAWGERRSFIPTREQQRRPVTNQDQHHHHYDDEYFVLSSTADLEKVSQNNVWLWRVIMAGDDSIPLRTVRVTSGPDEGYMSPPLRLHLRNILPASPEEPPIMPPPPCTP